MTRRSHDPYAPASQEPQEAPEAEEPQVPAEEPAGAEGGQEPPQGLTAADVPEKADDVVAWAGSDPERITLALGAEHGREKPRKTVLDLAKRLA